MAVVHPLHSSYFTNKPHHLLYKSLPSSLTITSQDSSSLPPKPTITDDPTSKPNTSTGLGFGSSQQPKPDASSTGKNKKKSKGERGPIIRRSPVGKPAFLDKKSEDDNVGEDQSVFERAFLLSWLGLGGLIFVEGLVLSASGFLPEEWDKFFVKFLYPSFTPTVFLFLACSVAYGVFKYFQNENLGNKK